MKPSAAAETLEVNKRGDHNDGFCTKQDCTLREAVGTIDASPEPSGKVILPEPQAVQADGRRRR